MKIKMSKEDIKNFKEKIEPKNILIGSTAIGSAYVLNGLGIAGGVLGAGVAVAGSTIAPVLLVAGGYYLGKGIKNKKNGRQENEK